MVNLDNKYFHLEISQKIPSTGYSYVDIYSYQGAELIIGVSELIRTMTDKNISLIA